MKDSFFQKLVNKVEHLGTDDLRAYFYRLSKEKGFLETIFNTLQEGIVVLSAEGRIEYFNRSAERLLSLPENPGAPIDRYLRGVNWPEILQEGQSTRRVLEIHYPEHRWLEFYLVPVGMDFEGEEGEGKESFAAIFHDVTQSRTMTEEVIESEKLRAVTLLAAGVAHELGNPINSLNIHLQLMERDVRKAPKALAKRLADSIDIARNELDRLDIIIQQFLKAIRPSRPELVPGRAERVMEQTLDLFKIQIKDKNIFLEKDFQTGLPEVMLDVEQLKQAFYNIVRNALQAMTDKGILRVNIARAENRVIVEVIDNGSGIAPEDLPHVFQPYYTTKESGHGLGLMIVQRIVREHGGELEVESEVGRGTLIRINLPVSTPQVHLLEDKRQDNYDKDFC